MAGGFVVLKVYKLEGVLVFHMVVVTNTQGGAKKGGGELIDTAL